MKTIPIRQIEVPGQDSRKPGKFRIRTITELLGSSDMMQDLHRHNFYYILVVQKGKGNHNIDFNQYKISAGSVFVLRPGQAHQLDLRKGSTGYLLVFDTEFYKPQDRQASMRLRKAGAKNFCKPATARFARLMDILSTMFAEFTAKEDGYTDAIRASLDLFFIELVRQSANPNSQPPTTTDYTQQRFEELADLLEHEISNVKSVSGYATMMNLSVYQLNAITRAMTGKTASDLINEQIILEARRYLLATTNQVKDIAYHLGYEDVSYFTRFFRKHTGLPPEDFRRHYR